MLRFCYFLVFAESCMQPRLETDSKTSPAAQASKRRTSARLSGLSGRSASPIVGEKQLTSPESRSATRSSPRLAALDSGVATQQQSGEDKVQSTT